MFLFLVFLDFLDFLVFLALLRNILPYLLQIAVKGFLVVAVNDFYQFFQFGADAFYVRFCAGIEQYFAQQGVVLGEYAFGNVQMALEGGSGRILFLHNGAEYKIPDFSNEEERKAYENDNLSPFPDENGVANYPCTKYDADKFDI